MKSSLKMGSSGAMLFPVSAEDADAITKLGIHSLGGNAPVQLPPPMIGYQLTKYQLLDSHTWQTLATPVEFQTRSNEVLQGFVFEINHHGSFLDGGAMAGRAFDRMIEGAKGIAVPITLASHQVGAVKKITFSKTTAPTGTTGTRLKCSGTGFMIAGSGYLLSNYHVVKGVNSIKVKTASGILDAKIIKVDISNDLVLLKVDGQHEHLSLGSSASVKVGEQVCTLGFPNPTIQGESVKFSEGRINSLSGLGDNVSRFQISVPLQPGNSGGPLLDSRGNVVGIIVSSLDERTALERTGALPQAVNYAIKSDYAKLMIAQVEDVSQHLKAANSDAKTLEEIAATAEKSVVRVLCY